MKYVLFWNAKASLVVDKEFSERIRERYPEGLTAILAIGATRTTYILEHNRESETPGKITDFNLYVSTTFDSLYKSKNITVT